MPTALLKPHKYLKVRYRVPARGKIEYRVEADRPVNTFVVDEKGLKEFMSRGSDVYSYYGGFTNRYEHEEEIRLPLKVQVEGWWYLLIENPHNEPVALHYEVGGN
jgi:hypothetical protein